MIRDAQPARLRELVELLEEIEPGFLFTTRAEDIPNCPRGSLVLLAPREEDLDWLNLNRPQFAQRELRAVLWTESPVSETFRFRAPDLHDWVSHFVRCPAGIPRFAIEGLRVGLRWWPGVAWHGAGLELALAQDDHKGALTLDATEEFAALVAALYTSRSTLVRWTNISTTRRLWRIRWALARAGHHGPNILVNPTVETPGWFSVDSRQMGLLEAISTLERAKIENYHKTVAHLELEPHPVHELAERSGLHANAPIDHQTLTQVATLRAAPHLQRSLHDCEDVLQTRRSIVRTIRKEPSNASWSRYQLGIYASIERDRSHWPKWQDLRLLLWKLEHWLRIDSHDQQRSTILSILMIIGEYDIAQYLADKWGKVPDSSEAARARDAWLEAASRAHRATSTDTTSGRLEQQLESLIKLADGIGWDVDFVAQTLAQLLRLSVTRSAPEIIFDTTERVLDAATAQLGATDPGYMVICRIAGVALGVAGLYERASTHLQHAWNHLRSSETTRAEVAAELAAVLAARGRFSEAAELLAQVSILDEETENLQRFVLRAMGEPTVTKRTTPHFVDTQAVARKYCEQRLFSFVQRAPI